MQRIRFQLDQADWKGLEAESLWAKRIKRGQYVLKNSPFYAYGVSAEDTVAARSVERTLVFDRILKRGGHSTFRILLPEGGSIKSRKFLKFWRRLEGLGCTFELASKHWLAVDVPPCARIDQVRLLLEKGEEASAWKFEEGHCGHKLDPQD